MIIQLYNYNNYSFINIYTIILKYIIYNNKQTTDSVWMKLLKLEEKPLLNHL